MYNTNLPNAPAYCGNSNEQFQAAIDDAASGVTDGIGEDLLNEGMQYLYSIF